MPSASRPRSISRTQVEVPDLSRPWQAADVVKHVISLIEQGSSTIKLELRACRRAFPNAVAPLRAALDEFESKGVRVVINDGVNTPSLRGLTHPVRPSDALNMPPKEALCQYYRFTSPRDVDELVTNLLASLSRCHECKPGVLLALEWSLNEVADNVIQHSQAAGGVLGASLEVNKRYLAICVADAGIGIRSSFELCGHMFQSDRAAITAALKRGVTRDAHIHQGNGLWGLRELVNANTGSLGIKSGEATYLLTGERESYNEGQPFMDRKRKGTAVDFQLQLDMSIDVEQALKGYTVNERLERLESATGDHVISLGENQLGTGTRLAGRAIRTHTLNTLHEGATRVVIDCKGVRMSSSFIDEVFGMLVVTLGFGNYTQRIGVRNLHSLDSSLMHDIVAKRLATSTRFEETP